MASESVATEIRIPFRPEVDGLVTDARPYALTAFDVVVQAQEWATDEVFAVAVDSGCNARVVGDSHPAFAAVFHAPGSLGAFARSDYVGVHGAQMVRIESRLPTAHRAAQASGGLI